MVTKLVTRECSFCGANFVPKRDTNPHATTYTCNKKICQLQYERMRMRKKRDSFDATSEWTDLISQTLQGDVVAEFQARVSGGGFTSDGGAKITFNVGPLQKHHLIHVTDYQGLMVDVVIRRPAEGEIILDERRVEEWAEKEVE